MASYLARLEAAQDQLRQGSPQELFDFLEQSHAEVLAELDAYERSDPPAALRLVALLWRFWMDRGMLSVGRRQLDKALALTTSDPSAVRAEALYGAGTLAFRQSDNQVAMSLYRESLCIARTAGARAIEASALGGLARCALRDRDIAAAADLASQSMAIARQLGDDPGLASALHVVAYTAYIDQDDERARALFEESIALETQLGNQRAVAGDLTNLGSVETRAGRLERAAELCAHALELARRTNSVYLMPYCLANIGGLWVAQGQAQHGARMLAAAEAMFERSGAAIDPGTAIEFERYRTRAREVLDDAAFQAAWTEGRSLDQERAIAEAAGSVA